MQTEIVGTWVSGLRQMNRGSMWFQLTILDAETMEVWGIAQENIVFHRHGGYALDGEMLTTPILNEGQPVRIQRVGAQLQLRIDDSLEIQFRRQ
jgi:hypothetical protein